jgi:hypothetical protein
MKPTRRKPYKKKKRGPVVSKKISYDGINFASGLEKYMYMALKKAKIRSKYEGETFVLLNGFHFENEVYERQSNGKGDYKNRGCKRILPIKYTPEYKPQNQKECDRTVELILEDRTVELILEKLKK